MEWVYQYALALIYLLACLCFRPPLLANTIRIVGEVSTWTYVSMTKAGLAVVEREKEERFFFYCGMLNGGSRATVCGDNKITNF